MSFFENNSVFFNPLPDGEGQHGFNDKRNRNPNWTDHEIVRFLEILQEEDTMKDLMAQRNKQVRWVVSLWRHYFSVAKVGRVVNNFEDLGFLTKVSLVSLLFTRTWNRDLECS